MSKQVINIGSAPNDGTGDKLRVAYDKCNQNFDELYAIVLYNNAITYILGRLTLGSDGNIYRAIGSTIGNDPTTDGGTNWQLHTVNVNTSLSVVAAGRFASIALAWTFLQNCRISSAATVTISVAIGTYTIAARAVFNHPNGDRIAIVGDTAHTNVPQAILSFTGLTSPGGTYLANTNGAISVHSGHTLGLLDGFKILGPGVGTGTTLCGVMAFDGATIIMGTHMWVTDWPLPVVAYNGSYVLADGIHVANGGDGNLFAYNGSAISAQNCLSEGASTNFSQSGACIEFNSSLFAPNSTFRNNAGSQVFLTHGATAMIDGSTLSNTGGGTYGLRMQDAVFVQDAGTTYTNVSKSLCRILTDDTVPAMRFGYNSNTGTSSFSTFQFIGAQGSLTGLSITQDNVAGAYMGFTSNSNVYKIATDGPEINFNVGSSNSLGGTKVASVTSSGVVISGTMTATITTLTGSSGGNNVTVSTGHSGGGGAGAPKELGIIANQSEQNAAFFQNLSISGYSANAFRTYQGNEVGSIGYCNPSASVFGGDFLIEVSDAANALSGLAPKLRISQYTNFTGSGAPGHFDRLVFEQDGTINFKAGAGGSAIYFTIAPATPVFTFAGSTAVIIDATSGSQIHLTSTTASIIGGATSLFLRGCSGGDYTDRTCEILVRESGGRSIIHRCFGGTLAQGGHQFLTGGTFGGGGQTQRFQISDDGVQSSVPFSVPGYTVATLPTPAAAGALAYVTDSTATIITGLGLAPVGGGANKVPVFYNGSSWIVI